MPYDKIDYDAWNLHGLYWNAEDRRFHFTLHAKDDSPLERLDWSATYVDFMRDNDISWNTLTQRQDNLTHWEIYKGIRRIASGVCKPEEFTFLYRVDQVCEYFGWKSHHVLVEKDWKQVLSEAEELGT